MSYRKFSSSQRTPDTSKPEYKVKAASVADQPITQPDKKQAEVVPAEKS
ncbi:MAG TPA: hypothetical protein VLE20_14160 [Blastocatellia bacterium]|nr:hypothetical protein [Blastocatellia bacterium]